MHEYTVELRIVGPTLDPDEVTAAIKISPTQIRRKGEQRSNHSVWPDNMWAFDAKPENGIHWDSLEEGLNSLLMTLGPLKAQLHSYLPANDVFIWCGHFTDSFDGGPIFSPTQLKSLGDFGVKLILETYSR
jgi:hypothetical protein